MSRRLCEGQAGPRRFVRCWGEEGRERSQTFGLILVEGPKDGVGKKRSFRFLELVSGDLFGTFSVNVEFRWFSIVCLPSGHKASICLSRTRIEHSDPMDPTFGILPSPKICNTGGACSPANDRTDFIPGLGPRPSSGPL